MYPEQQQNVNGWTVIREPRHQSGSDYSEDGDGGAEMDVDSRDYHQQQWYRQGREVCPPRPSPLPSLTYNTANTRLAQHVLRVSPSSSSSTRTAWVRLFPPTLSLAHHIIPPIHSRSAADRDVALGRLSPPPTHVHNTAVNIHWLRSPPRHRLVDHRPFQFNSPFLFLPLFPFHPPNRQSLLHHTLQTNTTRPCCIPTILLLPILPTHTSTNKLATLEVMADILNSLHPPHSSPTAIFPPFPRHRTV